MLEAVRYGNIGVLTDVDGAHTAAGRVAELTGMPRLVGPLERFVADQLPPADGVLFAVWRDARERDSVSVLTLGSAPRSESGAVAHPQGYLDARHDLIAGVGQDTMNMTFNVTWMETDGADVYALNGEVVDKVTKEKEEENKHLVFAATVPTRPAYECDSPDERERLL